MRYYTTQTLLFIQIARKALAWVKNVTDIPCLRINITLIFMSSSSNEYTHL